MIAASESVNVSGSAGRRLEDSSAAGGSLPGLRLNQGSNQSVLNHLMANPDNAEPDDDFFDMLVKCQVIIQTSERTGLFVWLNKGWKVLSVFMLNVDAHSL